MQVNDAISNAYDDNGEQYRTNAGQVLHRGVEVTVYQVLNQAVQLQVSATRAEHRYLDFVVNKGSATKEQDLSGHEMAQAPRYLINSRIFYAPSALPALKTQLEYQVVADYWMDDANNKRYGGFHLLNAKAHYQFNAALSSNLRIENLLDTHYASQVDIAYNKERYTPAAPRTIFAGINYQW
jgi:iron complex outermembrane recepter protein